MQSIQTWKQRVKRGGTFIILLHKPERWDAAKLLSLFDNISQLRLLKPAAAHKIRGSFYLIAQNVHSQHPEDPNAIADRELT